MSNEAAGISDEASSGNIAGVSSSGEAKKLETQADKAFALIASECGFKVETTENHLKRLQNLRKELSYISDTDWMYETLEKK